jgi:hypothetical protein
VVINLEPYNTPPFVNNFLEISIVFFIGVWLGISLFETPHLLFHSPHPSLCLMGIHQTLHEKWKNKVLNGLVLHWVMPSKWGVTMHITILQENLDALIGYLIMSHNL